MNKTALTLIITGSILFGFLLAVPFRQSASVTASGTLSAEQQTAQETPLYYVRVYNNMLAVYRGTEQTPWKITDIHVSSLREYDQKLMQQGFPLYSEQDLTTFLEDYGS